MGSREGGAVQLRLARPPARCAASAGGGDGGPRTSTRTESDSTAPVAVSTVYVATKLPSDAYACVGRKIDALSDVSFVPSPKFHVWRTMRSLVKRATPIASLNVTFPRTPVTLSRPASTMRWLLLGGEPAENVGSRTL